MASTLVVKSMRLFGIPYQFTDAVDPRLDSMSNIVGSKFLQNIILEGPVCTLIPGEPKYLPADVTTDSKISTSAALLESASEGFSSLKAFIKNKENGDDLRIYDFQRTYSRYMSYVNILCRAGATFLELDVGMDNTPFPRYDWRNYRQSTSSYSTVTGQAASALSSYAKTGLTKISKAVSGSKMKYETTEIDEDEDIFEEMEDLLTNHNFVQFYIDPDVSSSESMGNETSSSQLKTAFDSGSNMLKEIAFMANSGGEQEFTQQLTDFGASSAEALNTGLQSIIGGNGLISSTTSALSRIINLGSNVIKGDNVIMPDIYQSSSYNKSYSITVHLKSPYGSKLGYYLNIFVPMMHLIALALPKETTANTYGAPFLVKGYVDGLFTCNMGIVQSCSINRAVDSRTVDGLPTEVDVTLDIVDLYSDLSMSPQSSPTMFVNNSSLVEFLATNCGLSIVSPNIKARAKLVVSSITQAMRDIPTNIGSGIMEGLDNIFSKFTQLSR